MQKIVDAYVKIWSNFSNFSGRTNVPDYWWAFLGNVIIGLVLRVLCAIPLLGTVFAIVAGLYGLAAIIPCLALSARRLHDTGKSAWHLLIGLIPAVGEILLIVFLAMPSQESDNQYGPAGQSL